MSRRTLVPLTAALLSLLLSGCWVAERAIVRIKIERDGMYRLYVEGTAAQPESMRAIRAVEAEGKGGKLKPEELKKRQDEAQAQFAKALEELRKDPRFQEAKATGDGRVRFSADGTWRLDTGLLVYRELMAPLAYSVAPDGTIRLRVKDAEVQHEAAALGLSPEYDVSIVVAEGIEVLESNAQQTPSSPAGAYRWHIDKPGAPVPMLRIRLPAPQAAAPQKGLAHH